jgi:hypothetical protein
MLAAGTEPAIGFFSPLIAVAMLARPSSRPVLVVQRPYRQGFRGSIPNSQADRFTSADKVNGRLRTIGCRWIAAELHRILAFRHWRFAAVVEQSSTRGLAVAPQSAALA